MFLCLTGRVPSRRWAKEDFTTHVEPRKSSQAPAHCCDIATAACKQVPVCHDKGPGTLVHEGGRCLAGNTQPVDHSPALAEAPLYRGNRGGAPTQLVRGSSSSCFLGA